jgi:hypothetical protein
VYAGPRLDLRTNSLVTGQRVDGGNTLLGVGVSAAWGLNRAMLNIPCYLAFMIVAPPSWSGLTAADRTSTSYLLWNMLFLGGGALWAAPFLGPGSGRFDGATRSPGGARHPHLPGRGQNAPPPSAQTP